MLRYHQKHFIENCKEDKSVASGWPEKLSELTHILLIHTACRLYRRGNKPSAPWMIGSEGHSIHRPGSMLQSCCLILHRAEGSYPFQYRRQAQWINGVWVSLCHLNFNLAYSYFEYDQIKRFSPLTDSVYTYLCTIRLWYFIDNAGKWKCAIFLWVRTKLNPWPISKKICCPVWWRRRSPIRSMEAFLFDNWSRSSSNKWFNRSRDFYWTFWGIF